MYGSPGIKIVVRSKEFTPRFKTTEDLLTVSSRGRFARSLVKSTERRKV